MLNEEIPVNSNYQKKINNMPKLVETMFIFYINKSAKIVGKTLKYFPFQC